MLFKPIECKRRRINPIIKIEKGERKECKYLSEIA
jgi:hypothetical protein|tara:strand:- start:119 stop:223 length:105 start_codon:yes stop_codon:yes gene_type:complete